MNKTNWIKTENQLPEKHEIVLAKELESSDPFVAEFTCYDDNEFCFCNNQTGCPYNPDEILCWFPIPRFDL